MMYLLLCLAVYGFIGVAIFVMLSVSSMGSIASRAILALLWPLSAILLILVVPLIMCMAMWKMADKVTEEVVFPEDSEILSKLVEARRNANPKT